MDEMNLNNKNMPAGGVPEDEVPGDEKPGVADFRLALGIRFLEREIGYAKGEMEILPWHMNVLGIIHGGCLFSIADTVSGAAAASHGGRVTTVNSNINYLKAGKNTSKITAIAHETKYGRTLSVCDAQIFDDKDNLLATTTMTFYHLNG